MPDYYPVMLDIRGRQAIVIGGDHIAAQKAGALAASGAQVHVINPSFCEELLKLAEQKTVTLRSKVYEPGDLAGALIVIAATTDPQLIQAIWTETQERGQLVNIVDVPACCTFIMPSVLRRGQLTIAVSTEGASPSFAKHIRQNLEQIFPSAYGTYIQLATLARVQLRAQGVSYEQRGAFFSELFASEVLERLTQGDITAATEITAELLVHYGVHIAASALEADLEEEKIHVATQS